MGRKDLSNDNQVRVIQSMEPEICRKMFRNFNEKLRAKFPTTTPSYSIIKIARLDDAFLESFELEASKISVHARVKMS